MAILVEGAARVQRLVVRYIKKPIHRLVTLLLQTIEILSIAFGIVDFDHIIGPFIMNIKCVKPWAITMRRPKCLVYLVRYMLYNFITLF